MPVTTNTSAAVQEATVSCSSSVPPAGNPPTLEDEYIVERILDRRIHRGKIQYLIKWQGFADQDNTWEPEENLADCPMLIEDFNRRLIENLELTKVNPARASEVDRPTPISNAAREKALSEGDTVTLGKIGFDRGLQPQKIIGATDCGGEICFLMKWRGSNIADIVPAREANVKCPQTVIKFYESRINWNTRRPLREMLGEDDDDDEEDDEEEESESLDSLGMAERNIKGEEGNANGDCNGMEEDSGSDSDDDMEDSSGGDGEGDDSRMTNGID